MVLRYTVEEAAENLHEIILKARAGETILIEDGQDMPPARLVVDAFDQEFPAGKRVLGLLKGKIHMHDNFDDPIDGFEDHM